MDREVIISKVVEKLASSKKRYMASIIDTSGKVTYSSAHKSGGLWIIGGDTSRAQKGNKIFIHDLDDSKTYLLMGSHLKFQDKLGDEELKDLEKKYSEM